MLDERRHDGHISAIRRVIGLAAIALIGAAVVALLAIGVFAAGRAIIAGNAAPCAPEARVCVMPSW